MFYLNFKCCNCDHKFSTIDEQIVYCPKCNSSDVKVKWDEERLTKLDKNERVLKTSEIDKAIERLKSEGYTSSDIQKAVLKIEAETLKQPLIKCSLDEYLEYIKD